MFSRSLPSKHIQTSRICPPRLPLEDNGTLAGSYWRTQCVKRDDSIRFLSLKLQEYTVNSAEYHKRRSASFSGESEVEKTSAESPTLARTASAPIQGVGKWMGLVEVLLGWLVNDYGFWWLLMIYLTATVKSPRDYYGLLPFHPSFWLDADIWWLHINFICLFTIYILIYSYDIYIYIHTLRVIWCYMYSILV